MKMTRGLELPSYGDRLKELRLFSLQKGNLCEDFITTFLVQSYYSV